MRWLLAVLVVLLLVLQYRLWIAEGSLAEVHRLKSQVETFLTENEELRARNAVLEREVLHLQSGNEAVEQRAREQLNLVGEGEVFFQVVEPENTDSNAASKTENNNQGESAQ